MSLKHEQYRALKSSRELLRDLEYPAATPGIPKEIRERAHCCLRHWPFLEDDGEPMFSMDGVNESGWMPIGTEPLDKGILATDGKMIASYSVWQNDDGRRYTSPYGTSGYEMESDLEYEELTHWMPLPAPPIISMKEE